MTKPTRSKAARPGTGLAEALFTKTQQRVLGLLYGQSKRSFQVNEVITEAGSGSGAVQRELARLGAAGLLTSRVEGRQKLYQANHKAPIYAELARIVQKTITINEPLIRALKPFKSQIQVAFIFGSVAKRSDAANSDIDLFIVGSGLIYAELMSALEKPSRRFGRTVNPTIYTATELRGRIKTDNSFVKRVLQQPKLWIVGDEDKLLQLVSTHEDSPPP